MPIKKRSNFDYESLVQLLIKFLSKSGPVTAVEVCKNIEISQPVFSRLINKVNEKILVVGKARATLYALKRSIDNITEPAPIYLVNERGEVTIFAMLHAVYPKGFYYECKEKKHSRFFEDLPYFLEDLRPSGFLGRLLPNMHAEYNFPKDIRLWSSEHCIRYFIKFGWDLVGNIIIGEEAFKLYLIKKQETERVLENVEDIYPKLAEKVLNLGIIGSSAGGEQPKFLTMRNNTPVLVKFTPAVTDNKTQRISDLLVCEHLAHTVLKEAGETYGNSRIVMGSGRTFFEIERFDRIAHIGRRGIISLNALDLEFVGKIGTWVNTAKELLKQKKIDNALFQKIQGLELFGRLIGNTDMHNGNLSFFIDKEQITGLTPVYDMLPMMYMPSHEELTYKTIEPIKIEGNIDSNTWQRAYPLACSFWSRTMEHPHISSDFKTICKNNYEKLLELKDFHKFLPSA